MHSLLRPTYRFKVFHGSYVEIFQIWQSPLRKRVSHMAEMLQFDWLEPRGLNGGTGNLWPFS